jgi:hypothetical protein
VRIDIPLGVKGNVTAVYSIGKDWDHSNYFGRLKYRFGHFDISASYGHTYDTLTVFGPFASASRKLQKSLYGLDAAGEILGLGIWGEMAGNRVASSEDYIEALVGCDYTFSFQTYFMLEYYHTGLTPDKLRGPFEHWYTFNYWMRLITGEIKNLDQDYLFGFIEHPVHDLINAGFFSIINLHDKSAAINPQIVWLPFQDVEVTGIGSIGIGAYGTEYGTFDPSVLLRIRVSF